MGQAESQNKTEHECIIITSNAISNRCNICDFKGAYLQQPLSTLKVSGSKGNKANSKLP
jgi:hypothetical protein